MACAALAQGTGSEPGRSEPANAIGPREQANNAKLQRLVADLTLDKTMLQEVIRKNV